MTSTLKFHTFNVFHTIITHLLTNLFFSKTAKSLAWIQQSTFSLCETMCKQFWSCLQINCIIQMVTLSTFPTITKEPVRILSLFFEKNFLFFFEYSFSNLTGSIALISIWHAHWNSPRDLQISTFGLGFTKQFSF